MKNSILMGALVLAMALLPSFASATATPYLVSEGNFDTYQVPGTLLVVPTLDQDEGNAVITSASFDDQQMKWTVQVSCVSSDTDRCTGDIIS